MLKNTPAWCVFYHTFNLHTFNWITHIFESQGMKFNTPLVDNTPLGITHLLR